MSGDVLAEALGLFEVVLRFPKRLTPDLVRIWQAALAPDDFADEDIRRASQEIIRTQSDFPTPFEMRVKAKSARNDRLALRQLDAPPRLALEASAPVSDELRAEVRERFARLAEKVTAADGGPEFHAPSPDQISQAEATKKQLREQLQEAAG